MQDGAGACFKVCDASVMVRSAVVSKTVRVAVSGPERASPCRQTPMSRLISGAGALCARLDFPALLFVLAEPPRPCAPGTKRLRVCGSAALCLHRVSAESARHLKHQRAEIICEQFALSLELCFTT